MKLFRIIYSVQFARICLYNHTTNTLRLSNIINISLYSVNYFPVILTEYTDFFLPEVYIKQTSSYNCK